MVLSQLGLLIPLLPTARASSYSYQYRDLYRCFYAPDNAGEASGVPHALSIVFAFCILPRAFRIEK